MFSVSSLRVSSGCNRASHAADSGSTQAQIVFGSGPRVLLWDPTSGAGVTTSLAGHRANVTAVRFLDRDEAFVSGDAKGEVRLWRERRSEVIDAGCGASVTAIASSRIAGGHLLVVGCSDARVDLYLVLDQVRHAQQLDMPDRLPLDAAITRLPGCDALVLACACTDAKLRLWTAPSANESFRPALTLDGHTDWLRALSFTTLSDGDLLLASGSQDAMIRLWRIAAVSADLPERSMLDAPDGSDELVMRSRRFKIGQSAFACTSEAVLQGHDGWITDLRFEPAPHAKSPPRLLSASADNSLIIWSLDTSLQHPLWLPSGRLGDLTAGGAALGFFGALWSRTSTEELVSAHGWNGSFHVWRRTLPDGDWTASRSISGHMGEALDVVWDPAGDYLLSVSSDKSTRLHGSLPAADGTRTWHELARPQVHGHEMRSVVFLGQDRLSLVSAADEAVVRTFEAPATFVQAMKQYGALSQPLDETLRPAAAVMPPLGLSSRAVDRSEANGHVTALDRLPLEEDLASSTLWPETDKLYGHGFELRALASTPCGDLIATASAASSVQHAAIRLRLAPTASDKVWRDIGKPLPDGHSLSVTRLRFSPDQRGDRLLSVSRDRGWRVYKRDAAADTYSLEASSPKAHSRMIWDCAWSPDGSVFATASRDKTVKLWTRADLQWSAVATLQIGESATAVDIAPHDFDGKTVMAVGAESGLIRIFAWPIDDPAQCAQLHTIPEEYATGPDAWLNPQTGAHRTMDGGENGALIGQRPASPATADFIDFSRSRQNSVEANGETGSALRPASLRSHSSRSPRSNASRSPRSNHSRELPIRPQTAEDSDARESLRMPGQFARSRSASTSSSGAEEPSLPSPSYFQNRGRLSAGQAGTWTSDRRDSAATERPSGSSVAERRISNPIIERRTSSDRTPTPGAISPQLPPVPRDKRASLGMLFPVSTDESGRRQSTDASSMRSVHRRSGSASSVKGSPRFSSPPLPSGPFEVAANSRPPPPPKSTRRPATLRVSSGETTPMPSLNLHDPSLARSAPAVSRVIPPSPLDTALAYRLPSSYFPTSPLTGSWVQGSPSTDATDSPAIEQSPTQSSSAVDSPVVASSPFVGNAASLNADGDQTREDVIHRQAKRLTAEANRLDTYGLPHETEAESSPNDAGQRQQRPSLDQSRTRTIQAHPFSASVAAGPRPNGLPAVVQRTPSAPPALSPRRANASLFEGSPPPSPPDRGSSLRDDSPILTAARPRRTKSDESEQSHRTDKTGGTSLYESIGSREDLHEDVEDTYRLPTTTPTGLALAPAAELETAADAAERKRASKRRRAIQELVETERAYAQDLALARDVYLARAAGAPISAIQAYLQHSGFVTPATPNQVHEFDGRRSIQSPRTPTAASFQVSPLPSPSEMPVMSSQDIKTIFINIPELAQFAEAFSGVVEGASGSDGESDDDRLGAAFIEMIPRIAELYKPYCSRHGLALQRLEELSAGLEVYFKECQKICAGLSHAWSANALLVKPVQRCLKYPLLLEQILVSTPTDHPDHANLKLALERMLTVAHELNEAKRRQDLVGRVIRSNSISKSATKSSMRTSKSTQGIAHEAKRNGVRAEEGSSAGQKVMKKLMRSGTRAKLAAGYDTSVPGDAENSAALDLLIARFQSQSRALDAIVTDAQAWIDSVRRSLDSQRALAVNWAETFAALPGENDIRGGGYDALRQFIDAISHLRQVACQEAAVKIDHTIAPNVQRLQRAYLGPKTVISKRRDKLLDRQRAAAAKKGLSQDVEDDYTALTICLTEDLPTFLLKTRTVFDQIVCVLAQVQTELYNHMHSVLGGFEISNCFAYGDIADSGRLVEAWKEITRPTQALIDDLSITRYRATRIASRRPSSQSLRPQASRSSIASTAMAVSHSSSRANSLPGVPMAETDSSDGQRVRRSTADATPNDAVFLRPQPRVQTPSSSKDSWYRRSRTRSIMEDGAQYSPTRPSTGGSTPYEGARSSFASSSPSIGAFSQAGASSATSANGGKDYDAIQLPALYTAIVTESTQADARSGQTHEGQPLLGLDPGATIEVLYEAGTDPRDGTPIWMYARPAGSGMESAGFVRGRAVASFR